MILAGEVEDDPIAFQIVDKNGDYYISAREFHDVFGSSMSFNEVLDLFK